MTQYLFYQAGSIPGIPGTFANCRVDVADDGTLTQTPLPLAPHETGAQVASPIVTETTTAEEHLQALAQEVQTMLNEMQQSAPEA